MLNIPSEASLLFRFELRAIFGWLAVELVFRFLMHAVCGMLIMRVSVFVSKDTVVHTTLCSARFTSVL